MLRNLPADWQFDIAVNTNVDDHRPVFDRKRLIDLAEIIGAVHSETLGAEADGQFLEIGLSDFRIFGRKPLVDEVVPLLSNGVVIEYENGERQVMTDGGVEIGDVHHERSIGGDVGDPLARSRKTSPECDGQALPNRAEIRPS